jgi:hypothetical protein
MAPSRGACGTAIRIGQQLSCPPGCQRERFRRLPEAHGAPLIVRKRSVLGTVHTECLFIGVCRYQLRMPRFSEGSKQVVASREAEAGMGSLPAGPFHAPRNLLLGCESNSVLDLDCVPDQATGPLDEGAFVRETTLKKHTDAKVPGYIGHRDQRHVLGDA